MKTTLVDPEVHPSCQQLMMLVALGQAGWEQEVLVGNEGKTLITYFGMTEQELWILTVEIEPSFLVSAGTIEGMLLIDRADLGEFAWALKNKLEHLRGVWERLEAQWADNLPLAG